MTDRLGDLFDRDEKLRAVEKLADPYAVGLMKQIEEDIVDGLIKTKNDDERRDLAAQARAVRALMMWMEGIPRALKAVEDQIAKLKGRNPDAG